MFELMKDPRLEPLDVNGQKFGKLTYSAFDDYVDYEWVNAGVGCAFDWHTGDKAVAWAPFNCEHHWGFRGWERRTIPSSWAACQDRPGFGTYCFCEEAGGRTPPDYRTIHNGIRYPFRRQARKRRAALLVEPT